MLKTLILGLLVYFGILTGFHWGTKLDLETIIKYASVNLNNNCSGVVIDSQHILTASHCVRGYTKDRPQAVHVNGHVFIAFWERMDLEADLALLIVPGVHFTHWIKVAKEAPAIGSDIWCIGNPFGYLPDTLTRGVLGNKHRVSFFTKTPRWQYDCTIHGGNSGGMVINDRGELIAITTEALIGGYQAGTNFTFGVPLETILAFLNPIKCELFNVADFESEFQAANHTSPTYYRLRGEPFTKILDGLNKPLKAAGMHPLKADFVLLGVYQVINSGEIETRVLFALFKDGCLIPGGKNTMLKRDWDTFMESIGVRWNDIAEPFV